MPPAADRHSAPRPSAVPTRSAEAANPEAPTPTTGRTRAPDVPAPHRVVALALPGVVLLDLAAPTHLFGHCGGRRYAFALAGLAAGPVTTTTGFDVVAPHGLEALAEADTIVVPGLADHLGVPPPAVLDGLRAAAARGVRVMSVCTGAFVLAHAGLLDGRRATTHWQSAAQLAERFPLVEVDPAVLYVDEGRILTSAGVAAGLDLCLHVIRRDHGAELAGRLARRTVVAPHRDGGQAQFVPRPVTSGAPGFDADGRVVPNGLEPTRVWALERLVEPLDVATLARHACVSPRTFARRFREETGTTPAQWLLDQRTLAAQALLERTDLPIEQVAQRSGFGSAASLRQHLGRRARTTPTAYRRTFRDRTPEVLAPAPDAAGLTTVTG
jgi:AraC family transcriptional activator FtrA